MVTARPNIFSFEISICVLFHSMKHSCFLPFPISRLAVRSDVISSDYVMFMCNAAFIRILAGLLDCRLPFVHTTIEFHVKIILTFKCGNENVEKSNAVMFSMLLFLLVVLFWLCGYVFVCAILDTSFESVCRFCLTPVATLRIVQQFFGRFINPFPSASRLLLCPLTADPSPTHSLERSSVNKVNLGFCFSNASYFYSEKLKDFLTNYFNISYYWFLKKVSIEVLYKCSLMTVLCR